MKKMKLLALPFAFIGLISCSSDDDAANFAEVESKTMSNLHAPQEGGQGEPVSGAFTKFNFETGAVTASETDWDIAFRGTTIAVNGGISTGTVDEPTRNGNAAVAIVTGTFAEITEAPTATAFLQDSAVGFAISPSNNGGWYNYSGPPSHLITPIPGKILVFRTRNNHYVKVEILSYYKDAPANPDAFIDAARYFTFNYVYNPNKGQIGLINE